MSEERSQGYRGRNEKAAGSPRREGGSRKPGNQGRATDGSSAKAPDSQAEASAQKSGYIRSFASKASPARLAALGVCRAVREREAYAQDLIASRIDGARLSPEDRGFATRLVLGVVSCQGTLDEIINRALRSANDVQDDVRDALRIATYEIIFLEKSAHAGVDQGVELVRSVQPRAAGLGNSALRKIVGLKETFPFGDPTCDVAALARLYAFPIWIAKKLITDIGPQAAVNFMRASNEPAPLFVAVNALKATDQEIKGVFAEAKQDITPVELNGVLVPGCFRVQDARVLQDERIKSLFAKGKVLVSDAASQMVADLVLPEVMPNSFLEIGSGRGTKTILLQSGAKRRYGSQIKLVALDNHTFKTTLLRQRAKEYGVNLADVVTGDATRLHIDMPNRLFDAVFIDAPCSGLGTLRRHPEVRWRLTKQRVEELTVLSFDLLQSAAECVAPGGELTYATCTVIHAENNGVVKRFLESGVGSNFKLAPIAGQACFASQLTLDSSDAHFAVRFMRVK